MANDGRIYSIFLTNRFGDTVHMPQSQLLRVAAKDLFRNLESPLIMRIMLLVPKPLLLSLG